MTQNNDSKRIAERFGFTETGKSSMIVKDVMQEIVHYELQSENYKRK